MEADSILSYFLVCGEREHKLFLRNLGFVHATDCDHSSHCHLRAILGGIVKLRGVCKTIKTKVDVIIFKFMQNIMDKNCSIRENSFTFGGYCSKILMAFEFYQQPLFEHIRAIKEHKHNCRERSWLISQIEFDIVNENTDTIQETISACKDVINLNGYELVKISKKIIRESKSASFEQIQHRMESLVTLAGKMTRIQKQQILSYAFSVDCWKISNYIIKNWDVIPQEHLKYVFEKRKPSEICEIKPTLKITAMRKALTSTMRYGEWICVRELMLDPKTFPEEIISDLYNMFDNQENTKKRTAPQKRVSKRRKTQK